MDSVAAIDLGHGPPATAADAAPTGAQGSLLEGANNDQNNGANEALEDDANESLTDADQGVVTAAQKKKERQARKAAAAALVEVANKRKALRHQKRVLCASGSVYNVATESTPPERKIFVDAEKPAVSVGAFVQVAAALAIPGRARYGGKGWVVGVKNSGGATLVTVEYVAGSAQRSESDIKIGRLTELESPLLSSVSTSGYITMKSGSGGLWPASPRRAQPWAFSKRHCLPTTRTTSTR